MGRPSQVPGSYFIGESDLFQSLGSPAQINEIPDITPEMRIGRPVFTNDDRGVNTLLKREWHDYSDEIGSKNYGRGNAVAYGSMVLTHVKAVEMGRMLDRSMPQLFAGRPDNKRILQAYRSISREYTDFVREQDTEIVIAQNNAVFSNDMDRDEYDKNAKFWGVNVFNVSNQPANFGKCDLSVVFEFNDEELLKNEMHETWVFLRQQGLDTSIIDKSRRPHLSVFEAYHSLAKVGLHGARVPGQIMLKAPKAFTNDNRPGLE